MAKTALQQVLGNIAVPPTPKTGGTPKQMEQATATWTKQAQQAITRIAQVLGELNTSVIPEGSGVPVIGNVPTPPGVFYTDARARAALSATSPVLYNQPTGVFSIQLAKADGAFLGAAAFAAADFDDDGSGIISIDYLNGQKASSSLNGFLSSTDWTTFNAKVATSRLLNTTAPLLGGGDLSADRTFSISQSSASTDGYLSSTDWNTFNGKFNLPSLTSGSVLFSNGTTISQDNSNFFWDNANKRLGIGLATPTAGLDVFTLGGAATLHLRAENIVGREWLVFSDPGGAEYGNFQIQSSALRLELSATSLVFDIFNSDTNTDLAWHTNGGSPYLQVSNGTVAGLIGQSYNPDGVRTGSLTNHSYVLVTQNVNRVYITGAGMVGIGVVSPSEQLEVAGNLKLTTAGNGIKITEGTNATMGKATLSAGTVVVATTQVTANSRIFLTIDGGTLTNVGAPYVSARTAGTSFTISSSNALDSSDVAWLIVEPA